jgi:hypothetical protein
MKKLAIVLTLGIALTWASGLCAQGMSGQPAGMNGEHDFVHPFLAHMGLPDKAGEVSIRSTVFRTRFDGMTEGDFALHIEAGLGANLGLHVRSDGIEHEDYSEVMLQYALVADEEMHNGFSIFGQISYPTGAVEDDDLKGLFGISYRVRIGSAIQWDGDVHYNPEDEMAEYEDAFVFQASERFYPILELRGEITSDTTTLYAMPAIKFRLSESSAIGVGLQIAVTDDREYDSQALLTYGFEF